MEVFNMGNVDMRGKITACALTETGLQFTIGEHQGTFKPTGIITLHFDHQALVDFAGKFLDKRPDEGNQYLGRSVLKEIRRKLLGRKIDIIIPKRIF